MIGSICTDAALIPVYPGRPPVLQVNGVWYYVSVRDAVYLREWVDWRHKLQRHTDRGYRVAGVRQLLRSYRRWRETWVRWYAALGLFVPSPSLAIRTPPAPLQAHVRQTQASWWAAHRSTHSAKFKAARARPETIQKHRAYLDSAQGRADRVAAAHARWAKHRQRTAA